jgi:hypothetical protein
MPTAIIVPATNHMPVLDPGGSGALVGVGTTRAETSLIFDGGAGALAAEDLPRTTRRAAVTMGFGAEVTAGPMNFAPLERLKDLARGESGES